MPKPFVISPYRGYATPSRALILGRVIEEDLLETPDPKHSKWRNLVAVLKRIDSGAFPHARVRVRLHDADEIVETDDEGFVHEWVAATSPSGTHGWHEAEMSLEHPVPERPVRTRVEVLTPSPSAQFGVISDLDDTVLQSEVRNVLRAARLMLLENARTRLPFPGVAAFYRALQYGRLPAASAGNPIFYVSSSPWNFYDVITHFIDAQEIPVGPVLLRDWDVGPSLLKNTGHKRRHILDILSGYASLPFILIGDSSQEDPEIYSEIVREHPGRILAIYIRNVVPHPERSRKIIELASAVSDAGSRLVLADDTLAAARHAAAHGWIDEATLLEIGGEKKQDEGTRPGKVGAPGPQAPDAPTVVVDEDVSAHDVDSGTRD